MRALTLSEAEQVGGGESWGHFLANIQDLSAFGGTTGSILGYAITGTVQGATRGGFWGGGIGFAAGFGWGVGSAIYDSFLSQ